MCLNAFSLGANDAANAWGAAVGSDAISVGWAVVLCAIFDFLGAVTLGVHIRFTYMYSYIYVWTYASHQIGA
jgi:phosphate/sulfate permease